MSSKTVLRRYFKQSRQAIAPAQQQAAATALITQLDQLNLFAYSTFACYVGIGAELSLTPLIYQLWSRKKSVYLPVIDVAQQPAKLKFSGYAPGTPLILNQYHIPEPKLNQSSELIAVSALDIIFIPLLAFDLLGNRLGYGGGYYDRTLASLHNKNESISAKKTTPWLIGVAYACQQADSLPVDAWDVPLDAVVTERGYVGSYELPWL